MDYEKISKNFLEIASEQRLRILFSLYEKNMTLSQIVKKLEGTPSEIHRNLERLEKNGLVSRTSNLTYSLTVFGRVTCIQIPSMYFVSKYEKFFKTHNLDDLPQKFIHRIGELDPCQKISGFSKVLEKWVMIYQDAEKFIYSLTNEIPYFDDIVSAMLSRLEKGVKIKSIVSENVIIPDKRLVEQKKFQKYIQNGVISRKMIKNTKIIVLINEKEASIILSNNDQKTDMSEMFYSNNPSFIEWCIDYFDDCWENSSAFLESKILDKKE